MSKKPHLAVDLIVAIKLDSANCISGAQLYPYLYNIQLINRGSKRARVISSHWIVTDANGEVRRYDDDGLKDGERPRINPGQTFVYKTLFNLNTLTGKMRLWFTMMSDEGEIFETESSDLLMEPPPPTRTLH